MSGEPPVLPPGPPPSPSPEQPSSSTPLQLPSGNDPRQLDEARALGWNWGGFLLPYLWLIGHGRVTPALVLWISVGVPLLGFIHLFLYPATAIYLGLNGYEVSWRYRAYHSMASLQESEREWLIWGVVINVLLIFSMLLSFLYFRTMLAGMWEGMEGMEGMGW